MFAMSILEYTVKSLEMVVCVTFFSFQLPEKNITCDAFLSFIVTSDNGNIWPMSSHSNFTVS